MCTSPQTPIFGHYRGPNTGILKHQAFTRQFAAGEEMDACIIDNINKVVERNDFLYHLGDFCWQASKVGHYRNRINCKNITLIRGNHDGGADGLRKHFSRVADLMEIKVYDQPIVLCHYAMRTFNKQRYGSWHLYGHSHGSLPEDPFSLSFDVGVDCWGLGPISFQQAAIKMGGKKFYHIDHHTVKEDLDGEQSQ